MSMSTEATMAVGIVFETHSVTTDNEAGVATGWLDGQLSERGRTLAAALGRPVSRLERERAQRISRPFPDGESYLQVVARVASLLEELARDWDRARILVVGHSATRWALDHLLTGTALPNLVVAPFDWREGWCYELPQGRQAARPGRRLR
jgi:broad specificity phosphatase PhoE